MSCWISRTSFCTCGKIHLSPTLRLLYDSNLCPFNANSDYIVVFILDITGLTTRTSGLGYHNSLNNDHNFEQRTCALAQGILHQSYWLVPTDVPRLYIWCSDGICYRQLLLVQSSTKETKGQQKSWTRGEELVVTQCPMRWHHLTFYNMIITNLTIVEMLKRNEHLSIKFDSNCPLLLDITTGKWHRWQQNSSKWISN